MTFNKTVIDSFSLKLDDVTPLDVRRHRYHLLKLAEKIKQVVNPPSLNLTLQSRSGATYVYANYIKKDGKKKVQYIGKHISPDELESMQNELKKPIPYHFRVTGKRLDRMPKNRKRKYKLSFEEYKDHYGVDDWVRWCPKNIWIDTDEYQQATQKYRTDFDRLYHPMMTDIMANSLKGLNFVESMARKYLLVVKY